MNNGMENNHKLYFAKVAVVVLFAIYGTCSASCGDMCLLTFRSLEERGRCVKFLCAGTVNPAGKYKTDLLSVKRAINSRNKWDILSSKTSTAVGFPERTTTTCVDVCLSTYITFHERFSCVESACRSGSKDWALRRKKEAEIPDDSYDNDDSEQEGTLCEETCRMTFTKGSEFSACLEQVCLIEETEDENEPHESSEVAGKRPSSACKAMCKAKYFSIQARLTCMDEKCVGMYRSRVGRIKRNALLGDVSNIQLACFAMCDENHRELKDKIRCIKSHDCRAMYRDRVGRFGKRNEKDVGHKK